jgi:hypothetical protein
LVVLSQRRLTRPDGTRAYVRYQLAFRTPGIIPLSERSRKQMRQSPNFLRNARERPHRPQRLCCRTWNFGLRFDFSTIALRAIQKHSVFLSYQPMAISHQLLQVH